MSSDASHDRAVQASPGSLYERLSFILLLLILAWAPFPLGSNRPWAWSLLSLLIAAAWFFWTVSACRRPDTLPGLARGLLIPWVLALLALAWGVMQVLPIVPEAWAHPDWRMAGEALGKPLSGVISLSPWRTITEVMKLGSYLMVAWLARVHGARADRAGILLGGLIIIGACYVIYGFALTSLGQSQFSIFYGLTARSEVRNLAGPFVNHNSYATYAGLIALAAGVKLVGEGWSEIAIVVGARRLALTALHYVFGQGGVWLAAALLGLSAVIATGSRGGNFATFSALAVLLVLSIALAFRQARGGHAIGVTLFVGVGFIGLFAISGAFLGARLDDMSASGLTDDTRLMLWNAGLRMIHDAPFLGQGLGSYQIAYPFYAGRMMPFIMDKAHNDYVELAAGWGLPAAILWWLALAWLMGICVRGVLIRRRFRAYPMLAVGASILVGVHSIFDFSLQMPAIAVTFAAMLGLGVAQAFPAREQPPV